MEDELEAVFILEDEERTNPKSRRASVRDPTTAKVVSNLIISCDHVNRNG